jgi:transposase-like protein
MEAVMRCPACNSKATTERSERTELGYRRFRCRDCRRGFNERSGTVFNRLQYPTDVVCLVVLWRLRYTLSLRDLVEMFALRGFVFTHEAVREWEEKLAPHVTEELRKVRRGKVGRSWYTDETYLRVVGRWCYLYRAIDRTGNLVDVRLSETRDLAAAKAFFASAQAVTRITPQRVTAMMLILGPSRLNSAKRSRTGRAATSTIISSRIIAASRAGTGRCAASRAWCPPIGSAARMMRCATFSDPLRRKVGGSRSATDAGFISARSTGSSPSWSKPPDASVAVRCSQKPALARDLTEPDLWAVACR